MRIGGRLLWPELRRRRRPRLRFMLPKRIVMRQQQRLLLRQVQGEKRQQEMQGRVASAVPDYPWGPVGQDLLDRGCRGLIVRARVPGVRLWASAPLTKKHDQIWHIDRTVDNNVGGTTGARSPTAEENEQIRNTHGTTAVEIRGTPATENVR